MKIKSISNIILNYIKVPPKICIILGSGLNSLVNKIKNPINIKYKSIPGFITTSVKGHEGNFIYGKINEVPVLCANGRFHYYEGYSFKEIGSIIEIFNNLNPELCIITNSSGCLNINWNIGDFMIAKEFLDFSFIASDKSEKYSFLSKDHYNIIGLAKKNSINLHEGTYTFTLGPSYETISEIEEIITLGGGVVGMSTFPEFLACKKLNLNSIFISCLTNYGAGITHCTIKHKDVLTNANKFKEDFCKLLSIIIENTGLQKKQMK